MKDNEPNQWKRHNAFKGFVDKPLGYKSSSADEENDEKKVKLNSEASLSTLEQQVPSFPLLNLMVSAFKDNTTSLKFQLFVTRSYSPPTSTSPQPVYTLKITSESNSSAEATPVVTETRLVAECQIQLKSSL
ncbi:hypothetical protein Lal_00041940 [Lupinus albus]|uniref:Uncharacterized protein n=1 Tax=Lupinus albus TaxID=3870 RepID=A0A6A5PFM6_LUPAL|nr:hypothetical protein Lalb_Chr03g0043111 [Lupinus albus]KAF1895659.1 hypothetical protein Lal_00041940 [Lupinus albus]